MLTILWGLAGSGKSHILMRELTQRAARGGRHYLLVPEQFSHEQERALCRYGGPGISLNAEVLTFGRLADRVLTELGCGADGVLDEGGRLLLLSRALDAVFDKLTVWSSAARRPDFLPPLLKMMDECKAYLVSHESLALAHEAAEGTVGDTLHDLSLILTAYDAELGTAARDPRDLLTLAAASLPRSAYLRGHWTVDGFTRFTAQEREILKQLMSGTDVTVALTGAPGEVGEGLFAVARRTAGALTRLAGHVGASVAERTTEGAPRYANPALAHVSRHFLREEAAPFTGPVEDVTLMELGDIRTECTHAAALARALVRDRGWRCRDIAVVARDFETYSTLFEQAARRFELPLFLDRMDEVLYKPLFFFLSAALETVCQGYPGDAVFRMLKTGLFGLSHDECDRLENYVLSHRIGRAMWLSQADWTFPPRGYGQASNGGDEAALREVNALRRRVRGPLEALKKQAARDKTVQGQAGAVYAFLESIGLPERLRERCDTLRGLGELQRADEYEQMWDMLTGALDQCVALMADRPAELPAFSQMLRLVLSQYSVGSIPVSLDRLSCGSADRIRRRALKCVIVLGATDAAMPMPARSSGLIGQEERTFLREFGIELSPDADERLDQELDIIYGTFALPSEKLVVTWPRLGREGEEAHPSFAVKALRDLLGIRMEKQENADDMYTSAPGPCFEWLAGRPDGPVADAAWQALSADAVWQDKLDRLATCEAVGRGALSACRAETLYGREMTLSASRVETFMQCRYAYFLRYGLRARPRLNASYSALDRGNFVHHVLEMTLRAIVRRGGVRAVSDEEVRELAKKAAEEYVVRVLREHTGQTARFRRLFARLMRSVDAVILNVVAELRRSDFAPLDMELRFADGFEDALPAVPAGDNAKVTGIADRVDGWIEGGTLYVRVVDYKTGKKEFKLSDIYYGLGLQMFLYLFALEREGLGRYKSAGARAVKPAGVLYLPAREAYLKADRGATDEELRRMMAGELQRQGLILDDPAVIEAMERGIEGRAEYIPVQFNLKDGGISGRSSVASLERFGRLRRHVDRMFAEMERALRAGDVTAQPVCKGTLTACDHCDYVSACQFDERTGDKKRFLTAMRQEEFWQRMEQEEGL